MKVVLVPEGLEGERVDAAVARMLGLSRTRVADLVVAGGVLLDGAAVAKSDRVRSGAMLEVTSTTSAATGGRAAEVAGVTIVYDDDDIVVVDKPVGVAAHPSVGWDGPTCWVTWWPPASGSPPPACPSARASSSGSTSAPRG